MEQQVLGRIAGQGQLRETAPGRPRARRAPGARRIDDARRIALHIADQQVELRQCDAERLAHACSLTLRLPFRAGGFSCRRGGPARRTALLGLRDLPRRRAWRTPRIGRAPAGFAGLRLATQRLAAGWPRSSRRRLRRLCRAAVLAAFCAGRRRRAAQPLPGARRLVAAPARRRLAAARSSPLPSSAGDFTVRTPAASNASNLSAAVPLPPATMAPAWPMRLPGGAVTPAM